MLSALISVKETNMIMNNGQNTRSYSPVATSSNASRTQAEDPKMKLKELVKEQMEHEILHSLIIADIACAYAKMGLEGHECKMHCNAVEEYKENFDWRKYYYNVFEEIVPMQIHYESKELPKSLDDIHNKLYEMHSKNKERLHEILELAHEAKIYTDMDLLIHMYKKCEEYEEKLETKMKRSQVFGYDVAYILAKDIELKKKYKHKMHKEHKEHEEYKY